MLDLQYFPGAVVVHFRTAPQRSLDHGLLNRLDAALAYIGPGRAIVLIGTDDVFAPDLARAGDRSRALSRLADVRATMRAHPQPVVAAINGDALGAGWALAEAADVRVMSRGLVRPSGAHGRGYPVTAAVRAGLVEHTSTPARLLDDALALAGVLEPWAVATG